MRHTNIHTEERADRKMIRKLLTHFFLFTKTTFNAKTVNRIYFKKEKYSVFNKLFCEELFLVV